MSVRQAPKFPLLIAMSVETPAIDLPNGLSILGKAEHAAWQRDQRAAGVLGDGTRSGMVGVESIGGFLLMRHDMHHFPVTVGVIWGMRVVPHGTVSRFGCAIRSICRSLRALDWLSETPDFVRCHVVEETQEFARDITREAAARDDHGVHSAAPAMP